MTDSTPSTPSTPSTASTPRRKGSGSHKAFRYVGKVLRVVLPIAVSAVLAVWLFHKVDFAQIRHIASSDCNFLFIALMMLITMLSLTVRGFRWRLQLQAAGVPNSPVLVDVVAIYSAYALNLVVPYLGEAWRCVYISRHQKVKLATVVGTDFGDRGSDLIVVILITVLAFILARPTLLDFMQKFALGREVRELVGNWWLWGSLIGVIALFSLCTWIFRDHRFFHGVIVSLGRIWNGFKVLFTMKGVGLYLWLTLAIWVCYFLETYSCFWAFSFTRELALQPGMAMGLLPGLVVFVFGSLSMGVPSNGGLGPWNVAVMYALMLYGIGQKDAAAYSIVVWGFQTMMLVALGVFSAFYIMLTRRRAAHPKSKPAQAAAGTTAATPANP